MLYNMLCNSPSLNPALAENHFVYQIAQIYSFTLARNEIERDHYFDGLDDIRCFHAGLIGSFLEKVRNRYPPAKLAALKSILLAENMHVLHDLMPNARFLVIVRDPRDIASSMIRVGERQDALGIFSQFPRDIEVLAKIIMAAYQVILSKEFTGKEFKSLSQVTKVIRYEDLVADATGIVNQLGEWLGIDIPESEVAPFASSLRNFDSKESRNDAFYSENWGKAVTRQTIGNYQDTLSAEELTQLSHLCRPLNQSFEY